MKQSEIIRDFAAFFPSLAGKYCAEAFERCPSVRRRQMHLHGKKWHGLTKQEVGRPPLPVFVDLEITTACQLQCVYCARTFMGISSLHLQCRELERMLDALPFIVQVTLVGLGEPLLHPKLADVLRILKQRHLRIGLVTNGIALTPEKAQMLIKLGLDSITFSLDCMDRDIFEHLRKGADFSRIIENIRNFMEVKKKSASAMTVNIFLALQKETVGGLGDVARFAADIGIAALVVSELNFLENHARAISPDRSLSELEKVLLDEMRKVARCGVVLLGPNILDEVIPAIDWPAVRINRPEQILKKNGYKRERCLAPWRTLVVRVDGSVNFCNCTPAHSAGTLGNDNFDEIWRNAAYQNFRHRLYYGPVPSECRVCPRL